MANTNKKYLSKVSLGGAIYHLKDTEARGLINSLASPLLFKGVISAESEITSLKNYKSGWTYKINKVFTFNKQKVEPGDMLICVKNYDTSFNANDWSILQNNIDIMEGATFMINGTAGLVPAPKMTETNNILAGSGKWSNVCDILNSETIVFDCGMAPIE